MFAQSKWISVMMDGKPLSSKGLVVGGQLYVPAADVARALGMSVSYKQGSGTASLASTGGANQANGPEGKLDEWLFNGKTRLRVLSSTESSSDGTVYTLEVKNAEKVAKDYNFQSNSTKLTMYDSSDHEVIGTLQNRDDGFKTLPAASPYKVKWVFPIKDGFTPVRMVIYIHTQISGDSPVDEAFRIKF